MWVATIEADAGANAEGSSGGGGGGGAGGGGGDGVRGGGGGSRPVTAPPVAIPPAPHLGAVRHHDWRARYASLRRAAGCEV